MCHNHARGRLAARALGNDRRKVRWLRAEVMDMQDDQSGSESQRPGYVGPWSPPGDEAAQPAETSRAGTPSPDSPSFDAPPGQPGETAPLVMPPGAAGTPSPEVMASQVCTARRVLTARRVATVKVAGTVRRAGTATPPTTFSSHRRRHAGAGPGGYWSTSSSRRWPPGSARAS